MELQWPLPARAVYSPNLNIQNHINTGPSQVSVLFDVSQSHCPTLNFNLASCNLALGYHITIRLFANPTLEGNIHCRIANIDLFQNQH